MACEIRIGTSGWQYGHWKGPVYPSRFGTTRMLPAYARWFDSVEINSSFYGLPAEATVTSWRDATPPDFRFAWKGSRYITHLKKLKDPADSLERMYERADGLGSKLGPILFQLPPRFPCNPERLEGFIELLRPNYRYALEFRDPSWHADGVLALLRKHNLAWCSYELAGFRSPIEVTTDFTYVRLHGPTKEAYRGSYSDEQLAAWAAHVTNWRKTLRAVYIYFDNDEAGYAVYDASRLRSLVEPTLSPVPLPLR